MSARSGSSSGRAGAGDGRRGRGSDSGFRGRGDGQRGKGRGGSGQGARGQRTRPTEDERSGELAGQLGAVLGRLPATQREVLEYRMGLKDGHPHDLADTARALGLSTSEAREIERRAFDHIREVVPLDRLQKLLGS